MAAKDRKSRRAAWAPATQLVHEGTLRSQFGETSEAIFLNSGYVYESAEQAEARFKGDEDGYVYSRYANPTVSMFEGRMCALEGAEAARGTASGMAAVAASMLSHLKAGDHVVSGAGAVRQLPLHRGGPAAALRHHLDLDRRARSRGVGGGGHPQHARLLLREPDQSGAGARGHRRRGEDRQKVRRAHDRGQRVRHAARPAADEARRRHRRLLGDQAYRRPGPLPRRRRARQQGVHRREAAQFPEAHRAVAQPVQRLGHAQRARDAALARGAARRVGGADRRFPWPSVPRLRGSTIPAAPIIRSMRSPRGR